MSIGVTNVMIQDQMNIGQTTISVMVEIIMTEIIHLKEIMLTDNYTEEVIMKKTESLIIFDGKMIIAKEIGTSMITRSGWGLNHLSTNLEKEKIPILWMLDDLNMTLVNPTVHLYQIVTYTGMTVIMQFNVRQKTKERHQHQPSIWLSPKFSR